MKDTLLIITRWLNRDPMPEFEKTMLDYPEWCATSIDLALSVHGDINPDDKSIIYANHIGMPIYETNDLVFPRVIANLLTRFLTTKYRYIGFLDDDAYLGNPQRFSDQLHAAFLEPAYAWDTGWEVPCGATGPIAYKGLYGETITYPETGDWSASGCQLYTREALADSVEGWYPVLTRCKRIAAPIIGMCIELTNMGHTRFYLDEFKHRRATQYMQTVQEFNMGLHQIEYDYNMLRDRFRCTPYEAKFDTEISRKAAMDILVLKDYMKRHKLK
jgi:hypothetical protein